MFGWQFRNQVFDQREGSLRVRQSGQAALVKSNGSDRHGRERRVQANRCRTVGSRKSGLKLTFGEGRAQQPRRITPNSEAFRITERRVGILVFSGDVTGTPWGQGWPKC
jgi:hypothetical protein